MPRPAQLQGLTRDQLAAGGAQRRLRTLKNVRVMVADTLRGVENGWDGADPAVARVIFEGARTLSALIEASDTESKLRKLELLGARTLPASPVLERPQPPPRRAYVAPDRSRASEDASARPEATAAPDTVPEP